MEEDGRPYLYLSGKFEDIEFIGDSQLLLGTPFDAPSEFKRMAWAAALCYRMGNKSIDYVYKRYCKEIDFPRPVEPRLKLSKILRTCSFEVDRIKQEICNGVERASTTGFFAAEAALLRLSISFRYAAFLLMQGATFDAAAVLRLCLEQTAWAFDVHHLTSDDVWSKNPTKSITKLKAIAPECGRFYSLLSEYTHIDPDLQREYLDFSEKFASVLFRNFEAALEMGNLYATIVDLYVCAAEFISHKYFRSLRAWAISDDNTLQRVETYSCLKTSSF